MRQPYLSEIPRLILLVVLNGFFVAAEFALVKIRDTQLEPLVVEGASSGENCPEGDQQSGCCHERHAIGNHSGQPWIGRGGGTGFCRFACSQSLPGRGFPSESVQHGGAFALVSPALLSFILLRGELAPKSLAIRKPCRRRFWVATAIGLVFEISYPVHLDAESFCAMVVATSRHRTGQRIGAGHSERRVATVASPLRRRQSGAYARWDETLF